MCRCVCLTACVALASVPEADKAQLYGDALHCPYQTCPCNAFCTCSRSYASLFGIRMVKTNAWPTNHGMNVAITNCAVDCTSQTQNAVYTSAATTLASTGGFTLQVDAASIALEGLYRWVGHSFCASGSVA